MTCWTFFDEVIFYYIYIFGHVGSMWDSSSQPWPEPAPPSVEVWSPNLDCQGSSWNFLLLQLNLAYPDWYILAPTLDFKSQLQH